MTLEEQIKKSPRQPGVYQFFDQTGKVIYVGKAKNLRNRLKSYLQIKDLGAKTAKLVANISQISWIVVTSEIEALLLEASLIKKYQPKYNRVAKDDKSHLYIKISTDNIPQVTAARRQQPAKNIKLFGPFPSASTVRTVLLILRRIFPYCTHRRPQKSCLYIHLGLCSNPYQSEETLAAYHKDIKKIILFLSGKKDQLVKKLTKEMQKLSNEQKFEEAAKIKKQIEVLIYITQPVKKPEEYLAKPDLAEDTLREKLEKTKEELKLEKLPRRIECYDISNVAGKLATGSMVVFENGQPEKSQYRRFRIKLEQKPNDLLMLEEVLKRRFRNSWKLADLIVIDGGREQLRVTQKILNQEDLQIPVVSLAKRFEEIYFDTQSSPLKLAKDSKALQLLQYLRDEAHRFAIVYHRQLRKRKFF